MLYILPMNTKALVSVLSFKTMNGFVSKIEGNDIRDKADYNLNALTEIILNQRIKIKFCGF